MKKSEKLGLWMLTALVTGNIIGSGILMLPADLARVGSISLLAWIFTAGGALALSLVFAKMSNLLPKIGGPYAYSHAAFGDFIGFQTAYNYWIMVLIGNAAVAIAAIGYLRVFFPCLHSPLLGTTVAIGMVWIFTAINLRSVQAAGITQIITTILKFIPLLAVAILGWWYFHPTYITQNFNVTHTSNFSAFSYAATLTLWTFIGLESATIPADSTENPKRNIPLATILGTAIAMFIYFASTAALMGMIPHEILVNSTSPFAAANAVIFGKWGEWIAAAGAIISCLGVLNGWILIQGQMPMAAAADRLFPKIFNKRNKHNIPVSGQIISSIIVSLMLLATTNPSLIDQFQILILLATVIALLSYLYTAVAEIILLPKEGFKQRKNITQIIIAIFAAAYSFWAIFGSGKDIIFYLAILVFSSVPLYAWLKNSHTS